MPAPSALRALAILLLAGGCGGGGPPWSASFELGPATAETRFSVSAWKGKVRLRNSGSGLLEVKLRGRAPVPLDGLVTFAKEGRASRRSLRIGEAAKDADLELEVAAPPGISLACMCAEADVTVSGAWSRLEIATGGAIDARVEATGSGRLQSRSGDVVFAAQGAGPTGELRAESTNGDVAVTLPARWNGQIHFLTRTGTLDVPPHGNLRTLWDENKKGVVGHVGPPPEKGAPMATVWGTSGTGNVSFRVGE